MIPLKRILTYKSKLGFGKWKDYTVHELLDIQKKDVLISSYFKLTSITYTDEILDRLGINQEYRIEKPSSNNEMYLKFIEETKGFKIRSKNKMKPYMTKQTLSKSVLQNLNRK